MMGTFSHGIVVMPAHPLHVLSSANCAFPTFTGGNLHLSTAGFSEKATAMCQRLAGQWQARGKAGCGEAEPWPQTPESSPT